MSKRFSTLPWVKRSNMYEVNVRQYTPEGTFAAFGRHLPRLQDMGVEVLWFMPVTPISVEKRQGTLGSYYACSDYKQVNPEFGTLDDFRQLVRQAHQLGMKVIIDWVANHTGYDHVWTTSHPEFYKRNALGEFYDTNGWADVIDLNYYDQTMRREMISSMQFWVEACGIDGFRCDMAHLVPLDFWRDARLTLDAIRPLFWLAETETLEYLQVFDCCYAWDWMHVSEKYIRRLVDINQFINSLNRTKLSAAANSFHLFFTSNHDENSWNGTEYEKYDYAAKALAVLTATWPGLPLIYSGQELPNMKRLEFFDKDEIAWTAQVSLHDFYKKLLEIRKRNSALSASEAESQTQILVSAANVLAYERKSADASVIVLLNLGDQDQKVQLPGVTGSYRELFTGKKQQLKLHTEFELHKGDFLVLEK